MSWNLEQELGGPEQFKHLITMFYDRLFDDLMVGFLFQPHDKQHLIDSQMEWLRANLGDRSGAYQGKNIREAHANSPILVGHFDRRHTILRELLAEQSVPEHVMEAWLSLDTSLRDLVVRTGGKVRDEILNSEGD